MNDENMYFLRGMNVCMNDEVNEIKDSSASACSVTDHRHDVS